MSLRAPGSRVIDVLSSHGAARGGTCDEIGTCAMYGLVNKAIEQMVRMHHGDDAWAQIKARAGVETDAFVSMESYPDAVSYNLVAAASEHLGRPPEELLEAFGMHWTLYTAEQGYGELFRMGGRSFKEFMLNLHALHTRVAVSFPDLAPPSFWCTDVGERSLRLHYQSSREGLAPMVVGLVRGLGLMFDTRVSITPERTRADGADHDEFLVTFSPVGPP
jgi:hypothetical protein